jgi:hypothetical protein
MIIKTIQYERLKRLAKFENVRIGVMADLEDGDNPKTVAKELRVFVKTLLKKEK